MRILQSVCFLCCFLLQMGSGFAEAPDLEQLTAKSVVLLEARTGEVIYEKNSRLRLYPASTTKIATALVALDSGRLDDVITVGKAAAGVEGSSMNLAEGDQLTMQSLLYGVMMVSGNDATVAIAQHLAGSVEDFAKQMTQKAHEIGAVDTNFANSSGLPDENHYSTAYDLGKIAVYGYRNPEFKELVYRETRLVQWLHPVKQIVLEDTNLLLGLYPGGNGIKTGYTEAAGECLVASAERNGVHLIAVVMHADEDRRWDEAAALLDYGFERVELKLAHSQNALTQNVWVRRGENYKFTVRPKTDIYFPAMNDNSGNFSIRLDVPKVVQAPVREGQQLGWIRILYKGQEVDRVEMLADQDVARGDNLISLLIDWYETLYRVMSSFMI